jgi:hypothetical protein
VQDQQSTAHRVVVVVTCLNGAHIIELKNTEVVTPRDFENPTKYIIILIATAPKQL